MSKRTDCAEGFKYRPEQVGQVGRVGRVGRIGLAVALLTLLAAGGAGAQEPAQEPEQEPPPPAPKVERARIVPPSPPASAEAGGTAAPAAAEQPPVATLETRPGHHAVHEVRLVKEGAGRADGARQDGRIAFDMVSVDGRYDVYEMQLDGTGERCLTCDIWEFRKANVLSPAWHPSGDYLAVQVQSSPKRRGLDAVRLATPDRGLGCEIWIITEDGRDAFQLTQVEQRGGAVLDPHFSHEANLLAWSERLTSREPPWGEWAIRVVDFRIRRGAPHLGKTRTFTSGIGQGFAVAQEFTPDDGGLLLSAVPDRGLPEPDILRLDLDSGRFDRLTSSPDQSDEMVSAVPYSDYYVWVTDRGLEGGRRGPLPHRTEVWLRSASGMAQERLTYFNHPDSSHYLGSAMVSDLSWTADGESLLVSVVSVPEGSTEPKEAIFEVKLGKEYRR